MLHATQIVAILEAQAISVRELFSSPEAAQDTFERVNANVTVTASTLTTFANIPTTVALDPDSDISIYETELAAIADVVDWAGKQNLWWA